MDIYEEITPKEMKKDTLWRSVDDLYGVYIHSDGTLFIGDILFSVEDLDEVVRKTKIFRDRKKAIKGAL